MTLFTVGPVEMAPHIRQIGSMDLPYFRTQAFSELMFQIEKRFLNLIDAPIGAHAVLLTCSGTGAMESSVTSVFKPGQRVLVVDGGSFGHRFVQIAHAHGLTVDVLSVPFDDDLTRDLFEPFSMMHYDGVLIQGHETSIGKRYDLQMVGQWAHEHGAKLIVDAVSAFLVDPISMKDMGIDLLLTASQKALALPPGLSIVAMTQAVSDDILRDSRPQNLYLSLKEALLNSQRGQTPYTPSLGIIYQLDQRLKDIEAMGGVDACVMQAHDLAHYFRHEVVRQTPFKLPPYHFSNGLTPLLTGPVDAYQMFLDLMTQASLVLTPCGGAQASTLVRVGHMGHLHQSDFERLLNVMEQYARNV